VGAGSIQLARVFGIRIGASPSWFVVLFFMIYELSGLFDDAISGSSNTAYAVAVAAALLFFVSLVLHELGHAIVAQRNGIRVTRIDLWFFGGLARLTREPNSPGEDFRISAAGPAVTLAIFAACCAALLASGVSDLGSALRLDFAHTSPAKGLLAWLAGVNLVVLLFNLIPAYPLDGSRIARALVWRVTRDPNRGKRAAARLGQGLAYALMALGAYFLLMRRDGFGGIWFILLGWFFAQAARGEIISSRFSERLDGVTAADVMNAEPVTVPNGLSVLDAHDEFFGHHRNAWVPVVDGVGRFMGILRRESVDGAVSEGRPALTVGEVLDPDVDTGSVVGRETPIEQLLASETLRRFGALMVVDAESRLCGVVTLEDVRRALAAAVPGPVMDG
jgi:Zn-dependent protease